MRQKWYLFYENVYTLSFRLDVESLLIDTKKQNTIGIRMLHMSVVYTIINFSFKETQPGFFSGLLVTW